MGWFGGGVLGLFAGGALAAAVGIGLAEVLPISQAEGAYMMGVFFFWVPVTAILGAVLGVFLARKR